jgi:signal transduction histidine kinase
MRTPPSRKSSGGEGERLPARRPADEPAPRGEALVEHLVERLARTEAELRTTRDVLADSETRRRLVSEAARHLAEHPGAPLVALGRLALPALGEWALVEEIQGDRSDRGLAVLDPAREGSAAALCGPAFIDPDSAVGLGRALRGGRIERLDALPARHALALPPDAATQSALENLARGPLLVVPVHTNGQLAGALTFGRDAGAPPYDEADQRLASELAGFAALAIAQRRATAAAEESARAKSEFLTMMSHELRTPLNAIAGYAQLLEMGFRGPLNEGQKDAVDRILHGQRHLLELVDSVLTFSRLTSGRLVLDDADVSSAAVLATASDPVLGDFAEAGIDFRILRCAGDARVQGDRDRTAQILRHLLTNATKFTPRGGSVTLACEADEGMVRFVVTDTGRGIPAEQQEAIFHPFVQAEKGHTRSADGSGLGLAIGRELAERMGGTLTVASEVGAGSRFVLSLPRARGKDAAISIDRAGGPG